MNNVRRTDVHHHQPTKWNIKAFVFDLGGTLIDYEGLPSYWGGFYQEAFRMINDLLALNLTQEQIVDAVATLNRYNARINPREVEYSAAHVFADVTRAWNLRHYSASDVAFSFYQHFQRRVKVFPETVETLHLIKSRKYRIGVLTDVPTGMPEELVERDIAPFKDEIDYLLTSVEVGYRKPHRLGLEMLARKFEVDPHELAFVGDEEKDIQAARIVGATAIRISRNASSQSFGEDLQISTLLELKDLLR